MSNSRMVDAVNRLVGTLLAGPGEVFLPEVGSLYTERCAARQISKKAVVPPCRVVSFCSQQRGPSLVDKIEQTAKVETAQAEEIYRVWLARARKEEVLTIEGVGELKFKNFTLTPEFDAELNPQGHKPIRIKTSHRLDWVIWVGVAAIVFVAVAGAYQYWVMNYAGKADAGAVAASKTIAAADVSVASDSVEMAAVAVESIDSVSLTTTVSVAEPTPETSVVAAADPMTPRALESGRRYVVLGVFSALENARRAVENAGEVQTSCRIYVFGNKFLVSAFDSERAEACAEFVRNYSDRFPDLWIHSAR